MKFIAINGFMLIILAALLYFLSRDFRLDASFYLLQGVELLLGGVNISLMMLSIRDGMLLFGSLKRQRGGSGITVESCHSQISMMFFRHSFQCIPEIFNKMPFHGEHRSAT
jgi:hypothetical protein